MAQRSIEILIGRLITDEAFRDAFLTDGSQTLRSFGDTGHELTPLEIAAVLSTSPDLWTSAADQIDPRLQKANLAVKKEEQPR